MIYSSTGNFEFYSTHAGNYGWICPKCGKIFSPTTIECPYCNASNTVVMNETTNHKRKSGK